MARFINEHFALVVIGGVLALFSAVAFIGKPPPPPLEQPAVPVKLSAEQRKQLVDDVRSALLVRDAGPPTPDYSAFNDLPNMSKAEVVKKFWSYSEKTDAGMNEPHERLDVALEVKGALRRALVLVRVSRRLAPNEQVWLTIQNKGGHLLPTQSLPVPPDPQSMMLLYDTSDVPHARFGADGLPHPQESPSDWLSMLTSGNSPKLQTFLSATVGAFLDVSLFYECVEPGKCSVTPRPIR
jgi:hypothetical protein